MSLLYRLRKNWAGIRQKYRLTTQLRNVRKLLLFLFAVWLLGSILTIASQWLFVPEAHTTAADYARYFWIVIIELVSGFDIPDTIQLHVVSQAISILMLIMGLVVVGLFTGQIISMLVHVMERAQFFPEKPSDFRFRKPIIICGSNRKLYNIIRQLRHSAPSRDREIVLVAPDAHQVKKLDDPACKDIWQLSGDPADREVLKKALGKEDNRVIILSDENSSPGLTNTTAINTALAIEAYNEQVHTVVEIVDAANMIHFRRTRVNDWVCLSEFGSRLIAQAALQPGMGAVFAQLLGDQDGGASARIRFSAPLLAAGLAGKSYQEILELIMRQQPELDTTLIGFAKYIAAAEKERLKLRLRNTNYFIQVNPPRHSEQSTASRMQFSTGRLFYSTDTILNELDMLIYLGQHQIDFTRLSS